MWTVKQKETNEQTKINSQTRTEGWWLPEGKGEGKGKVGEGVKRMMTDGNLTFSGKHIVVYTDIELQCCTPETYTLLLTKVTSVKQESIAKSRKNTYLPGSGGR